MIFKPTSPSKILTQQRYEAERLRLEHEAAAEHHAALARMYVERIQRLDTITTPAKVTRVKARHPAPAYDHGDDGDNRSASGNSPMFLAALMAVMSPFIAIGLWMIIAYAIKN